MIVRSIGANPLTGRTAIGLVLFLASILLFPSGVSAAEDSVCARVKIEIRQEVTLERQAFDAHMRINNGLSNLTLENVDIDVHFTDSEGNAVLASSDPQATDALFFIRQSSKENIENISGSGTVGPSTSADIHWLIIPAPGASNGLESGTLYYVGATLRYTIGGEENLTQVTPDFIYVKPMPMLTLDYFLPRFVYGDDPGTTEIEPIEPFGLGVRVSNTGQGTARSLKIKSAQPKIIENENGLLINFAIEGSQVNGAPASPSLLCDFGDIPANEAATARWIMTCSLSGEFIDFDAEYTHADELGGELTSLMNDPVTHLLIRDVFVDAPGSDAVDDFLAQDEMVVRLYQSNGENSEVTDQSAQATLAEAGQSGGELLYTLTILPSAGFVYAQLPDPFDGSKVIKTATRSDGKQIKPQNVWLSKSRAEGTNWDRWFNLFDFNTGGTYTIRFADASALPQPPVMQFIPDRSVLEGNIISFIVEASDPNGTVPLLSVGTLPPGATFTDQGNGTGVFTWSTLTGQAGEYAISFSATDGTLLSSRKTKITVNALTDSDGDGLKDDWEMAQFGDLDRDGTGDADGDGISDYLEFLLGADPNREDNAPSVPEIQAPIDTAEVETLQPSLVIVNSTDPDEDLLTYEFEVFSDSALHSLVASATDVSEGTDTTQWTVTEPLSEDQLYFWRVRATDGIAYSLWQYGSFWVNTGNADPTAARLSRPSNGAQVTEPKPVFEIGNGIDPDEDMLSHVFEIYSDQGLTTLVSSSPELPAGVGGTTVWSGDTVPELTNGATYYWRVITTDEHGGQEVSEAAQFSIDTANTAPHPPAIHSPALDTDTATVDVDMVVANASDAEGDGLAYVFEIDRSASFNSPDLIVSDLISEDASGLTTWVVTGLVENGYYFWRAKAWDGTSESAWTNGGFRINAVNEPSIEPVLKNPGHLSWTETLSPQLITAPCFDPEADSLVYRFEVYTDSDLMVPVFQGESFTTEIDVDSPLENNRLYYWRALTTDAKGIRSEWSAPAQMFVRYVEPPPDTLEVELVTDGGSPIGGIRTYAFTAASAYTGLNAMTDAFGLAAYDLNDFSQGAYRFRADYLGQQFWSEDIEVPLETGITLVIPERSTTVTVTTAAGAAEGVRVYLFTESGAYLGVYTVTDANGQVTFDLPVGHRFKFRADLSGNQYWSAATEITEAGPNTVTVDTGGGRYRIFVKKSAESPLESIPVYLFSESGSYLGVEQTTTASGVAAFEVPAGRFKVRADYLGYQFWSDVSEITSDLDTELMIPHQDVRITVQADYQGQGTRLENIDTYLFTPSGSYLGVHPVTDVNGEVVLNLPEREYRVRADYMGQQFWSGIFTWADTVLGILMSDAEITVGWSSYTLQDVPVYAFTAAGSYLGLHQDTDPDGKVVFRLPVGDYKFRADYQSYLYWSSDVNLIADQMVPVIISAGGGTFTLTVQEEPSKPIEGVNCYLFNATGSYIGVYGPTNSAGTVSFDLANGDFKFRIDYRGYQFWTQEFTVPDVFSLTLDIPHQESVIRVEGSLAADIKPRTGVPVYLFTSAGSYLGLNEQTDANGEVRFNLPDQNYKVRADYLGQQSWSAPFRFEDTTVILPEGNARILVSGSGQPLSGVPVFVFSGSGSYLGLNATSDAGGRVSFRLPAGEYNFRADYQGSQYWESATILADIENDITVNTGGGVFNLTVDTGSSPLVGCRVYVFSSSGSYLGINGTTDDNGQVAFSLANGEYKFRADHLGYQFWTTEYTLPNTLSAVFAIPHLNIEARVNVDFPNLEGLQGVRVYLFTAAGAYMGQNFLTDSTGLTVFNLPDTEYKVRADYLGYQFWSDVFRSQPVVVNIHRGEVEVTALRGGVPVVGAKVYLFSESGSYLGKSVSTDSQGRATFVLPDRSYKFRVDDSGSQYWSDTVSVIAGGLNAVAVQLD